jgi:hypothetical protein
MTRPMVGAPRRDTDTGRHPAIIPMPNQTVDPLKETRRELFERALSSEPFRGLKAILDRLSPNREALWDAVDQTNSYAELLAKLGYRVTLIPQIHVQDAYSRMGPAGGIKAVLPYHDIPTQRSLPTLVNFESEVTTTPKAADFFNQMLAALKTGVNTQNRQP